MADTESISDLSLDDDGEINPDESIGTSSQTSVLESSGEFRKIPALNQAFKHVGYHGKTRIAECLNCTKKYKTNELERLVRHVMYQCEDVDPEIKTKVGSRYHQVQKTSKFNQTNFILAKMIVENNISFRCVESHSFRLFVQNLCETYHPPTRQSISSYYIPHLSNKAESTFKSFIKNKKFSISLEFDHWTDANHKSIFGVVATLISGERYLCNLTDVSLEGHSAASIINSLKESIDTLPSESINSFISDSASSCIKARETLNNETRYQHVIQHRCMAHWLNSIGTHFSKTPVIKGALKWAAKVARFVNQSTRLRAVLRESGIGQINSFTPTRWYSTANMIESLLTAKEVIVEEAPTIQDCHLEALITSASCWVAIKSVARIFNPLVKCIGIAERKEGSLGEAVKATLDYGCFLFASDWKDPIVMLAVRSYLTYFSLNKLKKEEFSLLIASYIMDHRYKTNFLTQEAISMALECIIKIAVKSKIDVDRIKRMLRPEFDSYVLMVGDYAIDNGENSTADWWSIRTDSGPLQHVAMRLAYLRSSSANIERTFSALRYIQGSWRMNLSVENMIHLTRLRIAKNEGLNDLLDGMEELSLDQDIFDDSEDSIAESSLGSNSDSAISQRITSTPVRQSPSFPADIPFEESLFWVPISSPVDSSSSSPELSQQERLDLLQGEKMKQLYRELTSFVDFSLTKVVSRPQEINNNEHLIEELVATSRSSRCVRESQDQETDSGTL